MPPRIVVVQHLRGRLTHPLDLRLLAGRGERAVRDVRGVRAAGEAPAILAHFGIVVAGVSDAAGEAVSAISKR